MLGVAGGNGNGDGDRATAVADGPGKALGEGGADLKWSEV